MNNFNKTRSLGEILNKALSLLILHLFICGKLKITAPWLKHLIGYKHLFPKYQVKISWGKKSIYYIHFTFGKGAFCIQIRDWHYRGWLSLNYCALIKNWPLVFHEIYTVWRVNNLQHSVKVSNQGALYFLNALCHIQWFVNNGVKSSCIFLSPLSLVCWIDRKFISRWKVFG